MYAPIVRRLFYYVKTTALVSIWSLTLHLCVDNLAVQCLFMLSQTFLVILGFTLRQFRFLGKADVAESNAAKACLFSAGH